MEQKTNPMRHLDRLGIPYETHHYEGGALSGAEVARVQGQDPAEVFKTLVTVGAPKSYYVFLVPVSFLLVCWCMQRCRVRRLIQRSSCASKAIVVRCPVSPMLSQ